MDSQTDVGGWPELVSVVAPADEDHDGMPDAWENLHGLNSTNPLDRNGIGEGGYTSLESYLNSPGLLTGVEGEVGEGGRPDGIWLLRNYPNPFNPRTTIEFVAGSTGEVRLRVYDILGRLVAEPFSGRAERGVAYRVPFEAGGSASASGVYIVCVGSSARQLAARMVVIQ
ncbi:MAG: T9SS type A sorting domain-containing protein [Bacteroidetes bacterium]|nr:T9SS type A sorting domain-containing protein [Bacteroidota bacterium]